MCRKRQEAPAAPPNTPANGMASTQQDSNPLRPSISSATQEVTLLASSPIRTHLAMHAMAQGPCRKAALKRESGSALL